MPFALLSVCRDKSPSQPQTVIAAIKTTVPSTPTTTTTTTSQAKPANMAFTPTSVIRKMHSDRVSEKEKQAKESDEDSGETSKHGTEKRGSESFEDSAVGSGEMGIETSELHTPSSFNSNLSALSSQIEEGLHLGASQDEPLLHHHGPEGIEDKVMFGVAGHVMGHIKGIPMIRPMVGQPVAPPPSATGGRPIVKGSADPLPTGPPAVPQPRPLTGGAQPTVKVDNEPRPIVGNSSSGAGFDLNKLLEQQQQQRLQQQGAVLPPHMAAPLPRPLGAGPAPPPPFMPITPGHIPLQAAASQASMQNAMIMQQINRVNAMNQMNQMNHLAALQVQQRMMDPRLQPLRTVIPTVNPASPLSPRSSLPSAIQGLAPPISTGVGISAGMKRSFSPAHSIFSQANKPVMNGPFSMGVPVSGVPNNTVPSEGEILKWFGPEVLKTQLPSMPPLPAHGTKVMTVDEIERS